MQLSSSWVATVFSHQTHSHQGGLVLAAPSRQPQGQGAGDWGTTNQTCRLWFTASESIQPTGKASPQEIRVKLCFPQGVSAKHTMLCLQQGDTVAERCASECAYASACVYIQGSVNKQDFLSKACIQSEWKIYGCAFHIGRYFHGGWKPITLPLKERWGYMFWDFVRYFAEAREKWKKKKEIDLTRKTETRSSPHCVVDHIAISTEPLSLAKWGIEDRRNSWWELCLSTRAGAFCGLFRP